MLSTGAPFADHRYRPEPRLPRAQKLVSPNSDSTGVSYTALSTGASTRQPPISTGAPRYRPEPPPAGLRYRPELHVYRPELPTADPGYRPELHVIDRSLQPAGLRYRPELHVIDRSFQPADPGYRPELHVIDRSFQPADPGYRPELHVIDRSFQPADPGYRPELRVIDRSSTGRLALSTGAPSISTGPVAANPRYRPELRSETPHIDRTPDVIDRSWESETPDIDRTPTVIDRSWNPETRRRSISSAGAVSKNRVSASFRFARASATVSPWLATSTSGHRATYPSASRSTIAVRWRIIAPSSYCQLRHRSSISTGARNPRHPISTGPPALSTGAGNPRRPISTGPPKLSTGAGSPRPSISTGASSLLTGASAYEARGAPVLPVGGRRACRSEDRRSQPCVFSPRSTPRALRPCGPRAG